MEANANEPTQRRVAMSDKRETIEHAQFGNKNAQETIRFMDKKIGVALAFISAICGSAYSVWSNSGNALLSGVSKMDWWSVIMGLTILSLVGFLVFLIRVIHYCCKGLVPKSPESGNAKVRHSVLFPFVPCNGKVDDYREGIKKLTTGMTDQDILEEYEDQSVILGQILASKMDASKAALLNLKWLFFFLISMCSFLGLVNVHAKNNEKAKKVTTVCNEKETLKPNEGNKCPIIRAP